MMYDLHRPYNTSYSHEAKLNSLHSRRIIREADGRGVIQHDREWYMVQHSQAHQLQVTGWDD